MSEHKITSDQVREYRCRKGIGLKQALAELKAQQENTVIEQKDAELKALRELISKIKQLITDHCLGE